MRILLDTNILARLIQRSHPQHDLARSAVRAARLRDDQLFIVPQILYELWVICTRPVAQNGLGMSAREALIELAGIRQLVILRRDERAILPAWERLVQLHEVRGKRAHDPRLVAAMLRHSLTHVLTFNADDFRGFSEVQLLTPHAAGDISGKA